MLVRNALAERVRNVLGLRFACADASVRVRRNHHILEQNSVEGRRFPVRTTHPTSEWSCTAAHDLLLHHLLWEDDDGAERSRESPRGITSNKTNRASPCLAQGSLKRSYLALMTSTSRDHDETCVVCMESLCEEHVHTMDGCGHTFHSKCIIGWLQRGNLSCPTCRDDLHQHEAGIPSMAIHDRAKYIRRTVGRRANVPSGLKRMLANLKRAEDAEKTHRRVWNEFRASNRNVIRRYNQLRGKGWRLHRNTNSRQRLLGLYQDGTLPLPALAVLQIHPIH